MDEDEIKKAIKNIKPNDYLGKGSYGYVYKLDFKGKKYAIKKISKLLIDYNPRKDLRPYLIAALQKEVDILKVMSTLENSVGFYGFYEDEEANEYIIILEYCDNDLDRLLASKGTFTSQEILNILEGLNEPFKYMHNNGIIHRDIKPDNILIKYIDSSYTKFIPKIGDYGFSRVLDDDGLAHTYVGTPKFMSPELIDYTGEYTDKSDIFSLGVMIYYLHFKSFPFQFKKKME